MRSGDHAPLSLLNSVNGFMFFHEAVFFILTHRFKIASQAEKFDIFSISQGGFIV